MNPTPDNHDQGPLESLADDALTLEIRRLWEILDPPPGDLADGVLATLAAIDLELDPYDPEKVHGYRLGLAATERIQAMLAALPVEERRKVTGLHPDRAPVIVAGVTILVESIRAFGLDEIEISESDILQGAAMAAAHR